MSKSQNDGGKQFEPAPVETAERVEAANPSAIQEEDAPTVSAPGETVTSDTPVPEDRSADEVNDKAEMSISEPQLKHEGVILDWDNLLTPIHEYYDIKHLTKLLSGHKGDTIVGFDFSGLDLVTDDVIIMLTESKDVTADKITFISLVGCVHVTDYAVKKLAAKFTNLKEVHFDGCLLLTERCLIDLKNCAGLEMITMTGTSVSIRISMTQNNSLKTLILDGCPLIQQEELELKPTPSIDPTKLIIMAKSNFTYDMREFLQRDVESDKAQPLTRSDINNIRYTPGLRLHNQDTQHFNLFETCASASIVGEFMSERSVYIVPMDMDTPAGLNPQVLFMGRMNNILAVSPQSYIILLAVHSDKSSIEVSERLIPLVHEMTGYFDLQLKALRTNITKWQHGSGEVKERHFQVQQAYAKMRRVAEYKSSFCLLQVNADTSKVLLHALTEAEQDNSEELTQQMDRLKHEADTKMTELVMPKMNSAQNSLRSMSKSDITELKSFTKPPEVVKKVAEAVLVMLKMTPTWDNFKKAVGDYRFLQKLQEYDLENVSDQILKKLDIYMKDESLTVENVNRVARAAAIMWAVVQYVYLYGKEVKPIMDQLRVINYRLTGNKKHGPGLILEMIRTSIKYQGAKHGPEVHASDWSIFSSVEKVLQELKDCKLMTLGSVLEKVKVTEDLRVLASVVKQLDIQGKVMYYPGGEEMTACVVLDIPWYMDVLNMLYKQKYTDTSLANGAFCKVLDPEVTIFTEDVIGRLIPACSQSNMRELFISLLVSQGILSALPRRSANENNLKTSQSHDRQYFMFCHLKSSFFRISPTTSNRAGRRYKERHWPDLGHESYSSTDTEIDLNYRLTTSLSLDLLPRFLAECTKLGHVVMVTKNSWIISCGAVEIQFKLNIKQVNVSNTYDIQARTTKFEDDPAACSKSVIQQYIWSVLSPYLTVLDALINQYPNVVCRIRSKQPEGSSLSDYFLANGYNNGKQSLLPFHDYRGVTDVNVICSDLRLYGNLPDDGSLSPDARVEWVCAHCGMSDQAIIRLWKQEISTYPASASVGFDQKKGTTSHVRGSLITTKRVSKGSSHRDRVMVVCSQALYLTGVHDVHITVLREGSVKLVVAKLDYFSETIKHDRNLEKARMTFDLGSGSCSMDEATDEGRHTQVTTQLDGGACRPGDTLTLHVTGSRLMYRGDTMYNLDTLLLELELLKNGQKIHTCHVMYKNALGIILEPSAEHAPAIIVQAPGFPMVSIRHFPLNTALVFRVKEGSQWLLGHVVDHEDGHVIVRSGATEMKLLPGSVDMQPLSAMLDGLTVQHNKGVVKSREQLRDYVRDFDGTPAPFSLFNAINCINSKVHASSLKMFQQEPRMCTMNVNSPYVLDMAYAQQMKDNEDMMHSSFKASYTHIYLPRNLDNHIIFHPTRQFVHKWQLQELHFVCNASPVYWDMHMMDMAPLEVDDITINKIKIHYTESIINTYHCLLKRQQDILPFAEQVLPAVQDLPKDEIIEGLRVLLEVYKNTFMLVHRLNERKMFMRVGGKVRANKNPATKAIINLCNKRKQNIEPGGLIMCETHLIDQLDNYLLVDKLSSLKYASCITHLLVELPLDDPLQKSDILDALSHFPNLRYLVMKKSVTLEGIDQFKGLVSLTVSGGQYTRLPDNLIHLKDSLQRLDISASPVEELPDFITQFSELRRLDISNTLIRELPKDIGNLRNLEKLMAAYTLLSGLPDSFSQLKKLDHLNMNGVFWQVLKPSRAISDSKMVTLQDILENVLPLVEHNLAYKKFMTEEKWQEFFDKADSKEQKYLTKEDWDFFNMQLFDFFPRLNYFKKRDEFGGLPPQLFQCRNLRVLSMINQGMRFLPDDVRKLPQLRIVNFADCPHLKNISMALGKAPLRVLDVTGCPSLKTPPKEIVSKGKKTVIAYIKRLSQGSVKTSRTKLMFVGLGGAGKTSLMRALMSKDHKTPPVEGEGITDGIDILTWEPQEKLTYSVWDFAGQTVYYNTHQFFMSSRAVYVLVWNTRLGYQHSGLEFWMSSIACHCPDSPVFVVGTHADQITNTELPEANLSKRFPNIKGFHVVSSYTGQGMEKFLAHLQKVTLDLPYMGGYIPEAWLNLEKAILSERSDNSLLEWEKVENLAHGSGIYDDEIKQVVLFLNDLGILQHFDNEFLRDRVVINPQWIVDVMACVISVHNTVIENGHLKHSDIRKLWKNYPAAERPWLLRLTEVFDLTFPLDEKQENIIPCLLPSSEPEYEWPDADAEGFMESKMMYKFDYLPAGLFNRAQVRLYQFSSDSTIWRHGSFLTKNDHYCLVKKTGDQNVLVKACGLRPENFLLLVHEIFEGLIAEFFTGVKYEYQIPCSDCVKMGTTDPAMFSSVVLRRAIDNKAYFLQCHTFFHTLSLTQLQSIIPPQSGSDFDIQMHNAVRELSDLEDNMRADVFFLMCKENIPAEEDADLVHPRDIKADLEKQDIACWYEEDFDGKSPEEIDLAMRTAKLILVLISDEFVEDAQCQSLFLHVRNRMKKDFVLLMMGREREWMNSALGGTVTGKVFINFQRKHQYKDKIKELIKAVNDRLGRNTVSILPNPDVFVSYCWVNSAEAIKIGHARPKEGSVSHGDPRLIGNFLEKHGLKCWFDYQRVGRRGLYQDIAEGMKQAKVVVACVSDEYVMSENCQMEFRFAHIALKKPIILAVVGTGFKWEATEIGMLALGYPKINFQVETSTSYQDLLVNVQEVVARALDKELQVSGGQKETTVKEKAFQELYEMAQRKFLRQVSGYTEDLEPFPRLFVADFNYSQTSDKDQDKDVTTEEISVEISENRPTFVVEDLHSGQFCIKLLCEYEAQWHVTETSYPIDLGGPELVQVWELVAPFMARVMSILKHSNIDLHIIGSPEGQKLLNLLEQKAGIEYNMVIKPIYSLLRKYIQLKDTQGNRGGLKRCHLPTGKYLWLCREHQQLPRVTVLEEDARTDEDDNSTPSPEYVLQHGLQDLALKWKKTDRDEDESRPTTARPLTARLLTPRSLSAEPVTIIKQGNPASDKMPHSTDTNTDHKSRTMSPDMSAKPGTNALGMHQATTEPHEQSEHGDGDWGPKEELGQATIAEVSAGNGTSIRPTPPPRRFNTDGVKSGSRPGSRSIRPKLSESEKKKVVKRASSHTMATLGYDGQVETSRACNIL